MYLIKFEELLKFHGRNLVQEIFEFEGGLLGHFDLQMLMKVKFEQNLLCSHFD